MDNAWRGSIDIAINKAFTSRAFDITTKDLGDNSQSGHQFFGIHASNHGRIMIFAGGIPLKKDGKVVGAIGISGGSGEQDRPSPGPAAADAVVVSTRLGEQADSLIGHFVDQARRSGASWSQIGASMGVTKQAAQQRFVPRGQLKDAAGFGDFSRFTQRARDVLAAAEDLARAADVAVIGREHLAAGLMAEPDGLAAKAIAALGVSAGQLARRSACRTSAPPRGRRRRRDHRRLGHRSRAAGRSGAATGDADAQRIPLGPGAVAALQATLRQALHLGHNYIGTEHILLGLVDEESSTAATLAGLGVTKAAVRKQIRRRSRRCGPAGRSGPARPARPTRCRGPGSRAGAWRRPACRAPAAGWPA